MDFTLRGLHAGDSLTAPTCARSTARPAVAATGGLPGARRTDRTVASGLTAHPVRGGAVAHQGEVLTGKVVGHEGARPPLGGGEVASAVAQVAPGGQGRVVDVVGIGDAVAVRVHAPTGPGLGNELHGPDGPVENRITVEAAPVGVADLGQSGPAVEGHAADRRVDAAVGGDGGAVVPAVPALDASDAGEGRPGETAVGARGGEGGGGVTVGLERGAGYAECLGLRRGPVPQLIGGAAWGVDVDRRDGGAGYGRDAVGDRDARLAWAPDRNPDDHEDRRSDRAEQDARPR
ncbi:hypothetical protein RHRU231_820128 [Rhodococcus ruber]|uniref:Uncharacterized protein n=1 Tax=Rhodococcus ruber TaxID=1830 RepID=A0A098BRK1_9NOCA|nr:hypothetical protein RHRU231_820128 [Rhodococcus ruber]